MGPLGRFGAADRIRTDDVQLGKATTALNRFSLSMLLARFLTMLRRRYPSGCPPLRRFWQNPWQKLGRIGAITRDTLLDHARRQPERNHAAVGNGYGLVRRDAQRLMLGQILSLDVLLFDPNQVFTCPLVAPQLLHTRALEILRMHRVRPHQTSEISVAVDNRKMLGGRSEQGTTFSRCRGGVARDALSLATAEHPLAEMGQLHARRSCTAGTGRLSRTSVLSPASADRIARRGGLGTSLADEEAATVLGFTSATMPS